MKIAEPRELRFMKRASSYGTIGTVAAGISILILAAVLAVAPEAFAWVRGIFGGGFGGEGFGGGGFNQGEDDRITLAGFYGEARPWSFI